VLTGADDRLVPTENSRRLAARIPGAELAVIPESAHVFFVTSKIKSPDFWF
jgi:pimeloyl-ACP methyl ester carboxylesterase